MKKYLEIGKIVGTYGVKGQLKLQPWCDTPQFILNFKELYLKDGKEKFNVISSFVKKSNVVLTIEGIGSLQDAMNFKNTVLYINRDDAKLNKDTYFIQDVIGAKVIDADTNKVYGIVEDVFKTGANDVYKVTSDDKKNYLFPAVESMIESINIKDKLIKIHPIEGIFDNEN